MPPVFNSNLAPLSKSVLIVDDEYFVLSCLEDFCNVLNKSYYLACNGEEALEIFARFSDHIDLVISDINMPKMNGVEFFKKVRAIKNVPMIMASGNYDDSEGLFKGYNDVSFLQKPFDFSILAKTISTLQKNNNFIQ